MRTSPWLRRIAETTAAGKPWSRVHVVDEPLSEYVRFEMVTYRESAAGETSGSPAGGPTPRLMPCKRISGCSTRRHQPFAALMHYDPDGHYIGAQVTSDAPPSDVQGSAGPRAQHAVPLTDYLADKDRGRVTKDSPASPELSAPGSAANCAGCACSRGCPAGRSRGRQGSASRLVPH